MHNREPFKKNNIRKLHRWSTIEEALRYLRNKEPNQHEKVLKETIEIMAPIKVGKKTYSPDTLIRAFAYYSVSRSLYKKLRRDYKLPSIKTLQNLTAKVNKISDQTLVNDVFAKLDERQKQTVVIIDEVYLKKALLYHGGQVFGKAVNKPGELATSMLGIMVKCLFGGPTFLLKMIPVTKVDSQFIYDQVSDTLDIIRNAGGSTISLVCDGNRTNQKLFKMFPTVPGKPWLTTSGMFILFDFVHLMKNIRNNWLTEQKGELSFTFDDETYTARWDDLVQLHKLEEQAGLNESGVVGLSKLKEVAVTPKPVERQRVDICLRVFCEETYTALKVHPDMQNTEARDTAFFIEKVVSMWKILNVKGTGKDIRHNNPLEAVIRSPDDPRLDYLQKMASIFLQMAKPQGGKRRKTLTKDTATGLHHTLNGLVELVKFQLQTTHDYVAINNYSQDPIEGEFGCFREGNGGSSLLTQQNCHEKLEIRKTRLLLKYHVDVSAYAVDIGHHCQYCGYLMDEKASEVFDNLEKLEDTISKATKMSLVHIAGYVTRKDPALDEEQLLNETTFYYQKYGDFTDSLDRGGLNVPTDSTCQWAFFCYVMFNQVKDTVCRTSLTNLFMVVSTMYTFNMTRNHGRILSNIFFKNHCVQNTPRSTKEAKQKVIKLSLES